MSILVVSKWGTLSVGICCHFSWARPLIAKVHSEHFLWQIRRFSGFLTEVTYVWAFGDISAECDHFDDQTQTFAKDLNYSNQKFQERHIQLTFHSYQNFNFGRFHGGNLCFNAWCHFSLAQSLGWLIPYLRKWYQLFYPKVSIASLMAKHHSDQYSCKKCPLSSLLKWVTNVWLYNVTSELGI